MSKLIPKSIGFFVNLISLVSTKYATKLAMKIFSTPRKGKLDNEARDFLNSAFQEEIPYLEYNLMSYRWLGKKQTILLVHGWESNSFRWKDLIEILKSQDYNIISIDGPAHGQSGNSTFNTLEYADCIYKVAEKFKANIIIGHSVGGVASGVTQFKYKLPSVNKMVLLGAPSNFKGLFERYIGMMGYNQKVSEAMNQYCLKTYGHLPSYFCIENFSKNIEAQVLIIHDRFDNIIPYSDALEFKKYLKNSELIKTKGLGHKLKSDDVYEHITDFLSA